MCEGTSEECFVLGRRAHLERSLDILHRAAEALDHWLGDRSRDDESEDFDDVFRQRLFDASFETAYEICQ